MTYDISGELRKHLHPPAVHFIDSVWHEEEIAPTETTQALRYETILADAAVQLVINLTSMPIQWSYDGQAWESQKTDCARVLIDGPRLTPIIVRRPVGSLVIRLGYGGSLALFGLDPQAVRNRIVPAEQFLSSEITVLLSSFELAFQNEWARRLARHLNVKAAPTKRLTEAKHLTDRAIDLMDSCPSIRGVCHRLRISHTWLSAATKMAAGLRPYELFRLRRFTAIAEELRADTRRLDDAGGFADQAHLIREFRMLSRYTPRRYVENLTRYVGHVSTAD